MNKKELKHLSFGSLVDYFSNYCKKISDHRLNPEYLMQEVASSAFAMFMFKDKSMLEFQNKLQEKERSNNLSTLFHLENIPTENQIRNVLDELSPEVFDEIYHEYFRRLQRGKHIEKFQVLNGYYTLAIDGSQYFTSKNIKCKHCLTKTDKEGKKRYYHSILQGTLTSPNLKIIIPFPPEEIRNEDGIKKQDCELNASKRLIPKIKKAHPKLKFLVNVDGLYGNNPFLNLLEENKMKFVSIVKKGSHKFLFEWIEANDEHKLNSTHEVVESREGRKGTKTRYHQYKWCNNVPLNGTMEKNVNYFEYALINEKGKKSYNPTWVTNLEITEKNIEELVRVARSRWKIENEGFNILKNHGYHLEHNFGHGKNHLSMVMFTLNILAFFSHEIQRLTSKKVIEFFDNNARYMFFENFTFLMKLTTFKDFDMLIDFTIGKRKFKLVPI